MMLIISSCKIILQEKLWTDKSFSAKMKKQKE